MEGIESLSQPLDEARFVQGILTVVGGVWTSALVMPRFFGAISFVFAGRGTYRHPFSFRYDSHEGNKSKDQTVIVIENRNHDLNFLKDEKDYTDGDDARLGDDLAGSGGKISTLQSYFGYYRGSSGFGCADSLVSDDR